MIPSITHQFLTPSEGLKNCGPMDADLSLRQKVMRCALFTIAALSVAYGVSYGSALYFSQVLEVTSPNILYYCEVIPAILAIMSIVVNWLMLAVEFANTK